MKLEKFSTMFTDFRFWITNVVYDVLRVDKPTIVTEQNLSFLASATDQEFVVRGNILQFDGLGGNFDLYIRFNEKSSPQYKVMGKSTFRIPFYRFFLSVVHNGGLVASQIRLKASMNNCYDALNTVDLAGKNAEQMLAFVKLQTYALTVPAGGNATLDWATVFGNYPSILRFLSMYNPDPLITLRYFIDPANPNGVDFFPTQQRDFNFSGCGFRIIPGTQTNILFTNPGANAVVVQLVIGMNRDTTFI